MSSNTDLNPAPDYAEMRRTLSRARNDTELFNNIVNAPFEYRIQTAYFFLGIIVLLLANPETGNIDRVALSNTELAEKTKEVSVMPFEDIKIGLNEPENIIAVAIRTHKPQDTTDWKYLFTPALQSDAARINQANAGIAYSAVYPFEARGGGALIFSYFQYKEYIGELQRDFMDKYCRMVSDSLSKS